MIPITSGHIAIWSTRKRVKELKGSFTELGLRGAILRATQRVLKPFRKVWRRVLLMAFQARSRLSRGRPVLVEVADVSFGLNPDRAVAFDVWTKKCIENRGLSFILHSLKPGMTFIDIGANVGLFTIPCAKKIETGSIYAFESCPKVYEILCKNLELNRIHGVTTNCIALSAYPGTCTISLNGRGADSLNTIGEATHPDARILGRETVPVITLDEFCEKEGIGRIDVIRISAEGAELFVLKGARHLLSRPDSPLILFESYSSMTRRFNYHPVEILWFLERFDYSFLVLDPASGTGKRRLPSHGYDAMMVAIKGSKSQLRPG